MCQLCFETTKGRNYGPYGSTTARHNPGHRNTLRDSLSDKLSGRKIELQVSSLDDLEVIDGTASGYPCIKRIQKKGEEWDPFFGLFRDRNGLLQWPVEPPPTPQYLCMLL